MNNCETIRRRLEGLLHFLDVSAPDLHNRFIDAVHGAETEETLHRLESEILAALKPPHSDES